MSNNVQLHIQGARENNLKDVNLAIDHDKFIVITGISGSGKSTLAFDTIYGEGGRRYIETFSPYTRQFLDRLHQPALDSISGVRPALALEQRNRTTTSRSTVGTITELNDYLKILWTHLSTLFCPNCKAAVIRNTSATVLHEIERYTGEKHTAEHSHRYLLITFPLTLTMGESQSPTLESLGAALQSQGFVRFFYEPLGKVCALDEPLLFDENELRKELFIVVDRFSLPKNPQESGFTEDLRGRILGSLDQAYSYGHGHLAVFFLESLTEGKPNFQKYIYHQEFICSSCDTHFHHPKPAIFSFNSPLGACKTCRGFGNILSLDPALCIPNHEKSLADGAIACWKTKATSWERRALFKFCKKNGIDTTVAWKKLTQKTQELIFFGSPGKDGFFGLKSWFDWLQQRTYKMHVRVLLSRYRTQSPCPDCAGSRLTPEALHYQINGLTLPELWQLPIDKALTFVEGLVREHSHDAVHIALEEVISRLRYLVQIGLGYLTLDRTTRTLSGGESQRVNLTSILGSRLVHTMLVLDEPTIGLHPRDTKLLINTLRGLQARPNSLFVVEHDPEVIRAADEIIDLGPQAGSFGGKLVYQGSVEGIKACKESLTGQYLSGKLLVPKSRSDDVHMHPSPRKDHRTGACKNSGNLPYLLPEREPEPLLISAPDPAPYSFIMGQEQERASGAVPVPGRKVPGICYAPEQTYLTIVGAKANNLKNISVRIPLQQLVVITGVSGSGKSSLIGNCLYEPFQRQGMSWKDVYDASLPVSDLKGLEHLDDIVFIDQRPVGTTPRSNPATYTKAWNIIRECLAETPQAQKLGLSKSAFSFNVEGGRCPTCKGAGFQRVEMQFLSDVFVECEACASLRFQDQVLSISYAGKSVVDLLSMSLDDVVAFFQQQGGEKKGKLVQNLLQPLIDLGLGYLRLGQPLSEVSGGEAQRIKLASYLSERTSKQKQRCLFLLDEPTTGLHPYNLISLHQTFARLLASGHSIVCIEHNLDVIRAADWIIDLGPEGGENGGNVVAEGTPFELLKNPRIREVSHTLTMLANDREAETLSVVTGRSAGGTLQREDNLGHGSAVSTTRSCIDIIGAREHNLKNVNVQIPHDKLTVITGVSGSGKSTLAFDIVFAEGQRRYIDSLSPYARQYITQLKKADVDLVTSLPPTIAVSQKSAPPLGISTIGTTTEIYQYLRLLYAKVGTQHCPKHDVPITGISAQAVTDEILSSFGEERIYVYAPVVSGRKGHYNELFQRALKAEINEAKIDDKIIKLTSDTRLERHKLHSISLLVASVNKPLKNRDLVQSAVEQGLLLGNGVVEVALGEKTAPLQVLSTQRMCSKCKRGFRELDPQDFSFRSIRGMCKRCRGHGYITSKNSAAQRKVCPECLGARIGPLGRHVYIGQKRIHELTAVTAPELEKFFLNHRFVKRLEPVVTPIVQEVLHRLQVIREIGLGYLQLDREASSISGGEAQRLRLARTLGSPLTGVCYVLDEPTIGLHPQDLGQLMRLLQILKAGGNTVIVVEHDAETILQADHVIDVGPQGGSAGGKIVIAGTVSQVMNCDQSLTGTALRERFHSQTKSALAVAVLAESPASSSDNGHVRQHLGDSIHLIGATANNLKNITVQFPLGKLSVVCGVSGAGKSSLVHATLVPAMLEVLSKQSPKQNTARTWREIKNHAPIVRLLEIDQTPIGKTSTSTPASFLGIFDDIRKLYAMLPEAKANGWSASHFSFNAGKGRCSNCRGKGFIRVPMSFLPEAITVCEECNGQRYHEQTLKVVYQGISIAELLQKTMSEAREILVNHKYIRRALDYVHELGLGYLTLGQPTYTLSGGEAQRLKIARELGSREAQATLYILDEPTIGLHMIDVDKLLSVMHKLIAKGNTVVIIEHNLDVLKAADYLIELGPGPGDGGGAVLFAGSPEQMVEQEIDSPTGKCLAVKSPPKYSHHAESFGSGAILA